MGRFSSPEARFRVLVVFLFLVFLTGGSSRDDMVQLLLLRPLTVLFGAYAIIHLERADLKIIKVPFALLLALFAVIAIQLIPLPPAIWTKLPKGGMIESVETAMGMTHGWRPLTLSPSKTWNSLFAMTVPITAFMLFAVQRPYQPQRIWFWVIILAIVSAVWGIIQITGAAGDLAYTYRITNPGVAVGLFANRNHHGVFLAACILISGWYFANQKHDVAQTSARIALSALSILLFLPVILLSNSRAGLIGAVLATGAALWFIASKQRAGKGITLRSGLNISRKWIVGGAAAAIGLLGLTSLLSSRSSVLERLIARDDADELRVQLVPIFQEMLQDFFPWGSGFGSFEYAYKMYEPVDMLQPTYVNLAHNDWAQWLIEGGLPGLILMLAFLSWLLLRARQVLDQPNNSDRSMKILALALIVLWGLGSIVDYPLRVPSITVLFTLCCFCLCRMPARRQNSVATSSDI